MAVKVCQSLVKLLMILQFAPAMNSLFQLWELQSPQQVYLAYGKLLRLEKIIGRTLAAPQPKPTLYKTELKLPWITDTR